MPVVVEGRVPSSPPANGFPGDDKDESLSKFKALLLPCTPLLLRCDDGGDLLQRSKRTAGA